MEEIEIFKLGTNILVNFVELLESMVVKYLWNCHLISDNVLLERSWKAHNTLMKKPCH